MSQNTIFNPFFAMILLTFLVWIYMYIRRINFINKQNITPQRLTATELAKISPPSVSNPSDNLKNLFEIPVLFYALVLYLYEVKQVDSIYVNAAWLFVIFRMCHSIVHCTFNFVLLRFYLYLFATSAVWFIAARAVLLHFSGSI